MSESPKPKKAKEQKFHHGAVVKRLLNRTEIGAAFWGREVKLLKGMIKLFPNLDFWGKVSFEKKVDSLAYWASDFGIKVVEKKYKEFHFTPPVSKEPVPADEKSSPAVPVAPH